MTSPSLLPSVTPRGELKMVVRVLCDRGLMLQRFGGRLTLAEFGRDLLEDFRMGEQIAFDDLFDLAALAVGEALRRYGNRRSAERERKKGGSEKYEARTLSKSFGKGISGSEARGECRLVFLVGHLG